jgi:hypothetical protein
MKLGSKVRVYNHNTNNYVYGTVEQIDKEGFIKLKGIVFWFSPSVIELTFH